MTGRTALAMTAAWAIGAGVAHPIVSLVGLLCLIWVFSAPPLPHPDDLAHRAGIPQSDDPCARCPEPLSAHPPDGPCSLCPCPGWAPRKDPA